MLASSKGTYPPRRTATLGWLLSPIMALEFNILKELFIFTTQGTTHYLKITLLVGYRFIFSQIISGNYVKRLNCTYSYYTSSITFCL